MLNCAREILSSVEVDIVLCCLLSSIKRTRRGKQDDVATKKCFNDVLPFILVMITVVWFHVVWLVVAIHIFVAAQVAKVFGS